MDNADPAAPTSDPSYTITDKARELVDTTTPNPLWDEHGHLYLMLEESWLEHGRLGWLCVSELVEKIRTFNREESATLPESEAEIRFSLSVLAGMGLVREVA